ncbi:uncharacterized protein LOC129750567 [Uranotaenia lowii]|uniref:uncharacterized protein LOC129750567 n=1 Tax=Uranotaenia lowii TaxID=190385 RepID=UPI00247AFD8E|nr:uncharacterized protein LOC129750567 [Uranotaenia lowii]
MAAVDKNAPSPATDTEGTSSCVACDKPDGAGNLVQCDQCDDWWHQSCAGVTDSIESKPWTCRKCVPAPSIASSTTTTSSRKRIQLKLEKLAEKRALEQKVLQVKLDAIHAEQKMVDEKYKLLRAAVEDPEENGSHRSRVTRRSSLQRTNDWLDQISEPENGVCDAAVLEPEISPTIPQHPPNSFATLPLAAGMHFGTTPKLNATNKGGRGGNSRKLIPTLNADVQHIEQLQRKRAGLKQHPNAAIPTAFPLPEFRADQQENYFVPNVITEDGETEQPSPPTKYTSNQHQQGKPVPTTDFNCQPMSPISNIDHYESLISQFGHMSPSESNIAQFMTDYKPTPSQLAARQTMNRDLPTFTGNPAEWPMFISIFTTTTLACGFNKAENLLRLQRCLKGAALDSVRSRLMMPNSVPNIIDTLRSFYGRPELLINDMLAKIRSIPPPKNDKLESLIEFGIIVQGFCDHLKAANQENHLSNPSLLSELVQRLPDNYKMQWADYSVVKSDVDLHDFGEFMNKLITSASRVTLYTGPTGRSEDRSKPKRGLLHAHMDVGQTTNRVLKCVACDGDHRLKDCAEFTSFNIDNRWQLVLKEGLCRNCLNFHGRRSCRVRGQCDVNGCQQRHHPLLHSPRLPPPSNETSNSFVNHHTVTSAENHTHRSSTSSHLFRILPITVYGSGNRKLNTYAFLDEGSSLTLMEEALAQELGIQGDPQVLCLKWTGNVTRTERNSQKLELEISGINLTKYHLQDTRTVKALTLPKQSLQYDSLSTMFRHLEGLPISSYTHAVPRILIGVNNIRLTVPLRVKEGKLNEPVATKTRLGWCVYGGTVGCLEKATVNLHTCVCITDRTLHDTVKDYFALEDTGIATSKVLESANDIRANKILEESTIRVGQRFQTGLLWKYDLDLIEFPDSFPMAMKRFECLERKLEKDLKIKQTIEQQIKDYLTKGYARRATNDELKNSDPRKVWYLPLGVVVNPKKPGKVRMVWDASVMVNGVSLNTMLLKGPDQLVALPRVLFRFRQFAIAVTGDIAEMYHQILIRPQDQQSQRFLWRSDPNKNLEVFIMQVATFGSTCSPASAQYVKNRNAMEFAEKYSRAVEEIIDGHYVDDYMGSFASKEEAKNVAVEIRDVHAQGGFKIRDWKSNCSEVIEVLEEQTTSNPSRVGINSTTSEKVLGMQWFSGEDLLAYCISFQPDLQKLITNRNRPTKRQVLKFLMSVFDPLGLLAAFVVQGKVLLQDVWRAGTKWDEEIDDQGFAKWIRWTDQFQLITDLRIPRCYYPSATDLQYKYLELHIFADASEDAYAAVAFFRIPVSHDSFQFSLVAAKTKVAPLKHCSIPRLELQAAVLATRLATFIKEGHTLTIDKIVFWSDSSTVLALIRSDHRRYKQFVACRVSEVLTTTTIADWRWISTKLNVADLATKWGQGGQLNSNSPWFQGPEFLKLDEQHWPKPKSILATNEEMKLCGIHHGITVPVPIIDPLRYSRWTRMLRVTAYILRYFNNVQKKRSKLNSIYLTRDELQNAENYLFRSVQWEAYPEEMSVLLSTTNVGVEKNSPLYKLSPYVDEQGVLRMDGRIGAAKNVEESTKFPVILCKQHPITDLLISHYHSKYHHANFETVVNEIRQCVYIPQIRSRVKIIINGCQWCKVYKTRPQVPRMAPLPAARLSSFTRPFSYVGLDLFGPVSVKVGRSKVKRWVALFTCLTIRAVHVEVVYSLDTQSCIMSIRRFVARRGSPLEFHSDNGTNFRGADNILQEQIRNIQEGLASTFTNTVTKWVFIPPGTPHMGGSWERMTHCFSATAAAAADTRRCCRTLRCWISLPWYHQDLSGRPGFHQVSTGIADALVRAGISCLP